MTRITVDPELCMASGYCLRELPEILVEEPDGLAAVKDAATVSPELEAVAAKAVRNCPSGALELHQD